MYYKLTFKQTESLLEETTEFVRALLETPTANAIAAKNTAGKGPGNFKKRVREMIAGRSFLTTREGYMGLGPPGARKEDIICVFLGTRAPLMLRALEHGTYRVVGECFVLGLMAGEALLGPLPRQYRATPKFFPEIGCYLIAYYNGETNKTESADPRLKGFPTHEEPSLRPCSYVHLDEDQVLRKPEAFEILGAKLQDFDLV